MKTAAAIAITTVVTALIFSHLPSSPDQTPNKTSISPLTGVTALSIKSQQHGQLTQFSRILASNTTMTAEVYNKHVSDSGLIHNPESKLLGDKLRELQEVQRAITAKEKALSDFNSAVLRRLAVNGLRQAFEPNSEKPHTHKANFLQNGLEAVAMIAYKAEHTQILKRATEGLTSNEERVIAIRQEIEKMTDKLTQELQESAEAANALPKSDLLTAQRDQLEQEISERRQILAERVKGTAQSQLSELMFGNEVQTARLQQPLTKAEATVAKQLHLAEKSQPWAAKAQRKAETGGSRRTLEHGSQNGRG